MAFWLWLKDFFIGWCDLLDVLWGRRFYVRCVLVLLALPVGAVGAVVLFWTLFGLVFGFLALHWADIALIVGVPVCFFSWLATRKKEKIVPPSTPTTSDALILEQAKQGLVALAEIVCAVLQDLAEYMPIVRPGSLSKLYCPTKSQCVEARSGLAVVSFMVYFNAENSGKPFDDKEFVEMFNLRMGQRLDARDLPGQPDPLFYDSRNNPHTSIQAIGCFPCGKYLKLDVVRVNEKAVELIEAIERAKTDDDGAPPAPPVSPYF